MNEKIEGLWWKARIGYNNQSCDPEVVAKFAELIVRECCDIVHSKTDESIRVVMAIEQHFGVEE
jgi:hypothetical protein